MLSTDFVNISKNTKITFTSQFTSSSFAAVTCRINKNLNSYASKLTDVATHVEQYTVVKKMANFERIVSLHKVGKKQGERSKNIYLLIFAINIKKDKPINVHGHLKWDR